MDWSRDEVAAIVADYLQMLTLELAGQNYSKTVHRRTLQQKLQGRSDASIEFKHGNISAAMIDPRISLHSRLQTSVKLSGFASDDCRRASSQ